MLDILKPREKAILLGLENKESEIKLAELHFKSKPSGRTYQLAKQNILEKIFLIIPFHNSSEKLQNVKIMLFRISSSIKVLDQIGLVANFKNLISSAIKKCITYGMWYEVAELYRIQSRIFTLEEFDLSKGDHFSNLSIKAIDIYKTELQFERVWKKYRHKLRLKKSNVELSALENEIMAQLKLMKK